MPDDTIIIKAPAGTKARWVRKKSQRDGMKLSDWIIQRTEQTMTTQKSVAVATIPDDVQFSDLKLARDADGHVSFDWGPIERICAASGIDVAVLRDGPDDNVASLLSGWYHQHIARGGARDATFDDLAGEARAENAAGQTYSHAPGRA